MCLLNASGYNRDSMEWRHDTLRCLRARRRGAGDARSLALKPPAASCRGPSTARSPAMRGWRGASPASCRSTSTTRTRFFGCRRCARRDRGAAPRRLRAARRRSTRRALPKPIARTAEVARRASPTCSSPTPTGCRSSSAASCASICQLGALRAVVRAASPSPISTATASTTSPAPTASTCSATTSTRACIERGAERVRELGPVLGAYHPVVADNVARLQEISGLDEVSFHMSGTEAVMQAVRLARYHTRRTHLVRFCGAYHGWWGDVQPGVGNPLPAHETYTLEGHVRGHAAGAAHAPRHRLRAGQSAAGAASQRGGAGRFGAGRQRAQRAFRPGGLRRVAQAAARGLQRARHRADLRRGVRRLPPRARRRAGIFRRARRPGDLRQDARRRPAGRRGVRPARI